ncbi:MAG TPA: hypothetical protein VGF40_16295 [Thermoanaerobaculia bacterium]
MFIGHFGAALGAKRFAPRSSLGALVLAAQFIDLLWPILLLAGLETVAIRPGITRVTPLDFEHYPLSHSLVMAAAWGVLLAFLYWLVSKSARGAVVVGLLVPSHWLLDLLVHRPDLPLAPGDSPKVGLGLWSSPAATIAVEGAIFLAGLALYARTTRARDRIGSAALWTLILFLLLIHAANFLSPPPKRWEQIAWVGNAQWLLVLWAWWADKHREVVDRRSLREPVPGPGFPLTLA